MASEPSEAEARPQKGREPACVSSRVQTGNTPQTRVRLRKDATSAEPNPYRGEQKNRNCQKRKLETHSSPKLLVERTLQSGASMSLMLKPPYESEPACASWARRECFVGAFTAIASLKHSSHGTVANNNRSLIADFKDSPKLQEGTPLAREIWRYCPGPRQGSRRPSRGPSDGERVRQKSHNQRTSLAEQFREEHMRNTRSRKSKYKEASPAVQSRKENQHPGT